MKRRPALFLLCSLTLIAASCAKAKHVGVVLGPATDPAVRAVRDEVRANDDARHKTLDEQLAKLTSSEFQKVIDRGRKMVDDQGLFARIPDGAAHQPKLQRAQALVEQSAELARAKKLDDMIAAGAEGFDIGAAEESSLRAKGERAADQATSAAWAERFETANEFLDQERVYFALGEIAGVLRDIHADTLEVLGQYAPKDVRFATFRQTAAERAKLAKDSLGALRLELVLLWSCRREVDPDNETKMRARLRELGLEDKLNAPAVAPAKGDAGAPCLLCPTTNDGGAR